MSLTPRIGYFNCDVWNSEESTVNSLMKGPITVINIGSKMLEFNLNLTQFQKLTYGEIDLSLIYIILIILHIN